MLSHFSVRKGDIFNEMRQSAQFAPYCAESTCEDMKLQHLYLVLMAFGLMQASLIGAEGLEPPVPVRTVAPRFPEEMKRNGSSGLVTVSCLIDEKGNVTEPEVIKTSNAAFSQPAVDALKKWRFKPAKKDGTPVAIRVNIPVQFTID